MQFAAKQGSSASCGCPQTGSSTVTIEGVGAVRVGRDHATGKIQGGIATITVNGFPIATAGDPIDGHLHGFHNVDPRIANAARTVTVGRSDLASRSCANPVGKGGCIDFQSVERTEAITGQDGVHVQQTQPVSREDVDRHAVAASNHRPVVINVRKVSASGVVDPRAIKVFFTHGSFNISSSKAQYLLENVLTALGDTHGKPPVTSISVFNMCFQAQNYDSLNLALERLGKPGWQHWVGDIIFNYHLGPGWQQRIAKLSSQEQQAIWSRVRRDIGTQFTWIRDHIPFPDTVGWSAGNAFGYGASDVTDLYHLNDRPNAVPGLQE